MDERYERTVLAFARRLVDDFGALLIELFQCCAYVVDTECDVMDARPAFVEKLAYR